MFWLSYLASYCFCAMLFSVSHSSIMSIFCCLCYMPSVYLKCLMFALCSVSFILHIMQKFNILFIWLKIAAAMYIYVYISIYIYIYIYRPVKTGGAGGLQSPSPQILLNSYSSITIALHTTPSMLLGVETKKKTISKKF